MEPSVRTPAQDRILDAAEIVFADKGYRGGALNDIAVALGYTRAGLLHHYPSKEAILLAILERRDERLDIRGAVPPDAGIFEALDHLTPFLRDYHELRTLIQLGHVLDAEAASPSHPARGWAAARGTYLRNQLLAAIVRSQERGEFARDVRPDVLAAFVLGTVEGLESQWLLDESVDLAEGMALLRRLLESLRPTH